MLHFNFVNVCQLQTSHLHTDANRVFVCERHGLKGKTIHVVMHKIKKKDGLITYHVINITSNKLSSCLIYNLCVN